MKSKKTFIIIVITGAVLPFLLSFWKLPTWILKQDNPSQSITSQHPVSKLQLPFKFPFQYNLLKSDLVPISCDPPGSSNCYATANSKETSDVDIIALGIDLGLWLLLAFALSFVPYKKSHTIS